MTGNTYDIGLVCMTNLNIGNNLTNYALYQYLNDLNYRVLLISNPSDTSFQFPDTMDNRFKLFLKPPYLEYGVMSPVENKWQLASMNLICDKFVLGSDQLWRDIFVKEMDFFSCLEWVESWKYKIAYATSFGIGRFECDENTKEKMGYLLRRFQKISVREPEGVKLLEELYGIEAQCVLDPVFLCDKKYYEKMAANGKIHLPHGRYIGAYLLDITEEKEDAVLTVSENKTKGVYEIMTEPGTVVNVNVKLSVIAELAVEEWLAMVQNCDFFVTDSFHGLCFALIFKKQFCVIFDEGNWRGLSRIQSLLGLLQLDSRLVQNYKGDKILGLYDEIIDYDKVSAILSMECERSKNWLKKSLWESKDYQGQYGIHDFVWNLGGILQTRMNRFQEELKQIKEKDYKTRNELYILKHSLPKVICGKKKSENESVQIVGWGAGACFRRNINKIREFYDIKYVCDSDSKKWGREIIGGVICISPQKLLEMENVLVIIMIDQVAVAFQIAKKLLELGINNFDHVENWLFFIEGNA